MASFHEDQAAGLRRLLGARKPRIYTFLSSTSGSEKSAVLLNLGATISRGGSVLVVDSYDCPSSVSAILGVPQGVTIIEVARRRGLDLSEAVRAMPHGFSVSTLARNSVSGLNSERLSEMDRELLHNALGALLKKNDILLVDAELDERNMLPANMMGEGEIIVQMSQTKESITNAYVLIKKLGNQLGKRQLSIMLTGVSEVDGEKIFRNIAETANRHLGLELTHFGTIPQDEFVGRAAKMRRSVVEAFPKAKASVAFRQIAEKFTLGSKMMTGMSI